MKILVLYTKNRVEIFDKKSAIGSCIYFLTSLLNEKGISVFLNDGESEKKIRIKKSINNKIYSYMDKTTSLLEFDKQKYIYWKISYYKLDFWNKIISIFQKFSPQVQNKLK